MQREVSAVNPTMTVTVETQLGAIAAPEWNALLQRSTARSIFQSYEWHDSLLRGFPDKYREVYFVCVRDDGALVCIAPLTIDVRKGKRVLQFIGHVLSDFTGFIYDNARPESVERVAAFIGAEWDVPWDHALLKSVPMTVEEPRNLVRKLRAAGLYALAFEKCASAAIRLDDAGFLSEIDGKRKLKQQLNRLIRMGKYEVAHLQTYEAIEPYLDRFFAQHIDQWASSDTPSFFLDELNKTFYRSFLAAMSREGLVAFTAILLDGVPLAFGVGFIYDHAYLYYKTSYNIAYLKRSPGSVLLLELIEFARQNGLHEFNYGVGFESYKGRFCNVVSDVYSYKVFRGAFEFRVSAFVWHTIERIREIRGGQTLLNAVKKLSGFRWDA